VAITTGTDALQQVPLFEDLAPADVALLADALMEAEFPAGARIFEPGDTNASLYVARGR